MPITTTQLDNLAYAKLGGALDNLSDSYTYIAKGLSAADGARDPLMNSGGMAKFIKISGTAQKAFSYVRKIEDALDEKKREGGLLKLGFKVSIDLAGKLLGTSLTTHPYYAWHKSQIDALADALNANRNSRDAVDAYRRAVKAANSEAMTKEFKRFSSLKTDTVVKHYDIKDKIAVASDVARGMGSGEYLKKKIQRYGAAELRQAVKDLEAWRANWSGLAFDVMQLQLMAGSELNVATEAMAKVKDLIATLMGGSNTSRVGGYAAINTIEWEKYDQIVTQQKPDQSLTDPIKYAQGNVEKAEAWGQAFSAMCDFVRSSDVVFQKEFDKQLIKLNDVIYNKYPA